MKSPQHRRLTGAGSRTMRQNRRGAGRANDPTPGWKGWDDVTAFANPRPPSVPATLHITIDEYFATASLMGLLAASRKEPNKKWAKDWSFEMGDIMAAESVRRRRRRKQ